MGEQAHPPVPAASGSFPPAAAWWSDARGELIALSPRWEQLTGRSVEKECGGGWLAHVPPDDVRRWHEARSAAVRAGRELRVDLRVRAREGGWLWLRMHGLPEQDGAGMLTGFVGSATDVSDLRRMQDELIGEVRRLARADRELDQLVHVGVHDLQAPLRNLDYLLSELAAGELDPAAVKPLRRLTRSALDIAGNVLDFARVGRQEPSAEPVDARRSLDWALAHLAPAIERARASVVIRPLPRVYADPIHLGRIFQNLVSNALRYAGDAPPHVEISASRDADQVVFRVSDRGVGVPPDQREEVFGLFSRLPGDQDVPGTGAGLAICRKLVELHGGRIWIEPTSGPGASFLFTLLAIDDAS